MLEFTSPLESGRMSVNTIDPSESEDLLDSSEDDGQSDSRKRPRVAFQDRLDDPPKTSATPVPCQSTSFV